MERCEDCGKNRKRYRSYISSWICDNCKKETIDYKHPNAFIKIQASNWWSFLSNDERVRIYLENNTNNDTIKENLKEEIKESVIEDRKNDIK